VSDAAALRSRCGLFFGAVAALTRDCARFRTLLRGTATAGAPPDSSWPEVYAADLPAGAPAEVTRLAVLRRAQLARVGELVDADVLAAAAAANAGPVIVGHVAGPSHAEVALRVAAADSRELPPKHLVDGMFHVTLPVRFLHSLGRSPFYERWSGTVDGHADEFAELLRGLGAEAARADEHLAATPAQAGARHPPVILVARAVAFLAEYQLVHGVAPPHAAVYGRLGVSKATYYRQVRDTERYRTAYALAGDPSNVRRGYRNADRTVDAPADDADAVEEVDWRLDTEAARRPRR
jgi:hypothetical protein